MKFKVGDSVKINNPGSEEDGLLGVIIKVCEDVEDNYGPEYIVEGADVLYRITEEFLDLYLAPVKKPTSDYIKEECTELMNLLLEKNRKYGDSALSEGILYKLDPITAIKARINDKLNRVVNDNKDEDEDVEKDLIGYFILLRIARKIKGNATNP